MRLRPPTPLTGPHSKSAMSRVFNKTSASIKVHIFDAFTSLDNFVVLSGGPLITSGRLSGVGVVRHKDKCATDNYKVTAVVGSSDDGKTMLITCGSAGFDRFYGLEIENGVIDQFHIIKGTNLTWTTSFSIFGISIGLPSLLVGLFSAFSNLFHYSTQPQIVTTGDTVAIWFDQPNSTVRAYKNNTEVTSLVVPPHEIPHGEEFRYFGVMQGSLFSFNGVQFTSIEAQDV